MLADSGGLQGCPFALCTSTEGDFVKQIHVLSIAAEETKCQLIHEANIRVVKIISNDPFDIRYLVMKGAPGCIAYTFSDRAVSPF